MKVFNSLSLVAIGAILTFAAMKYGKPPSAPDLMPVAQAAPDTGQIGRFQTFNNLSGVALDTKTGRLCRTHDWHIQKPGHGVVTVIPSPYEHEPLCYQ